MGGMRESARPVVKGRRRLDENLFSFRVVRVDADPDPLLPRVLVGKGACWMWFGKQDERNMIVRAAAQAFFGRLTAMWALVGCGVRVRRHGR